MGSLKKYDVEVNGVNTTLVLSDDDAKARGLTGGTAYDAPEQPGPVTVGVPTAEDNLITSKGAPAPANKARTAENK